MLYNKRKEEGAKQDHIAGGQVYVGHENKVPLNLW